MRKNSIDTEKKRKKRHGRGFKIFIYVVIVLVLYAVIFVVPKVTGFFDSSYPAEYGEFKTEDSTTGYVIRKEKVYLAEVGGSVNRLQKEEELVRKGTVIVEISGEPGKEPDLSEEGEKIMNRIRREGVVTDDNVTENGGLVSYYADGYEKKLTPDNAFSHKKDFYESLSDDDFFEIGKGDIAGEEPVYKIIDKNRWYLLVYMKESKKERYSPGTIVETVFGEDEDHPMRMKVVKTKKEGRNIKILLSSDQLYENIGKMRKEPVRLITSKARGLIIDKGSLTKKDGETGVYIKNKQGRPVFKPVLVLASNEKKAVIADSYFQNSEGTKIDTVCPYQDVYKEPKK